ncbi:MAG: hypothetical protein IIC04_01535 [Proteobacteria bacterium]|nr:hypothetical protein [Pseudomonadota bacterium]
MACNFADSMRTLALPKEVEHWSLSRLREKLVRIGAKVVRPWPVRHLPIGRGGGAEETVAVGFQRRKDIPTAVQFGYSDYGT